MLNNDPTVSGFFATPTLWIYVRLVKKKPVVSPRHSWGGGESYCRRRDPPLCVRRGQLCFIAFHCSFKTAQILDLFVIC